MKQSRSYLDLLFGRVHGAWTNSESLHQPPKFRSTTKGQQQKCVDLSITLTMAPTGTMSARSLPIHSDVTLRNLSDDLLYQILLFLPSMNDLHSFVLSMKRFNELVHHSPISENLFCAIYKHRFGDIGSKSHWRARYGLKTCLLRVSRDPTATPTYTSISILTDKQERQALLYDNGSGNTNLSMGYFGMKELWESGPVCVWGDFRGVRLVPSLDSLMKKDRNLEKEQTVSIVLDESMILTVMVHGQFLFLGCASGKVHIVSATKEQPGQYSYEVINTATNHKNKVTSMSILPSPPRLITASCDGACWLFPESISKTCFKVAQQIISVDQAILNIQGVDRSTLWTSHSSGILYLWKHNPPHGWVKHQVVDTPPPIQTLALPGFKGVIIGDNQETIHAVTTHTLQWHTTCKVGRPAELLSRFGDALIVGGGTQDGGLSIIQLEQSTDDFTLSFGKHHVLKCHPGKRLQGVIAFSSIVSTFVVPARQSLITLSRDGTLAEWKFETLNSVTIAKQRKENTHKSRKRPQSPEATSLCGNLDTLIEFMKNADARTISRTRMRIIQCAFQQQHVPTCSSVCVDGVLYKDISAVFNCYSSLPSCSICSDPYLCRMVHHHMQGLMGSLFETQLFLMLHNATSVKMEDVDWFCGTCHVGNQDSSIKCRLCQKPKPITSMKQPSNTIKVWNCCYCQANNMVQKHHCIHFRNEEQIVNFQPNDNLPLAKESCPKRLKLTDQNFVFKKT